MIFSAVSSYSDYYKESSANTVASATLDGKSYFWGQMTGTSQASPFVAGVIATWLEANPELSPEDIQLILKKTARSDSYTGTCPNPVYGYGKIDALAGIGEVLSPSGIDRPTSAGKPYRLYRDGILFTEQAGRTRIVLTSPDGIVRYDATVETPPGSRIEWQATGVPTGSISYASAVTARRCSCATRYLRVNDKRGISTTPVEIPLLLSCHAPRPRPGRMLRVICPVPCAGRSFRHAISSWHAGTSSGHS